MGSVRATIKIRNDTAANWLEQNPILASGELGAENDTGLLKLGDGINHYNDLEYINGSGVGGDGALLTTVQDKLTVADFGKSYWEYSDMTGEVIKRTDPNLNNWPERIELDVRPTNGVIKARWVKPKINYDPITGTLRNATVYLDHDPQSANEAATRNYVLTTINNQINRVGHLKRAVVTTLPSNSNEWDVDTIYLLRDTTATGGDQYKEYIVMETSPGVQELIQIGDTSVDLTNYLKKPDSYTVNHTVVMNAAGELEDSGHEAAPPLTVATTVALGGVKSSGLVNSIRVDENYGYMYINTISTDKLVDGAGEFIINGGSA